MARKRRLNLKFLIFLLVPFVLLGALGVAYETIPQVKWMYRGTPKSHVAKGKALYEQGEYEKAGEEFARALQLKKSPDAEMYTLWGDCYSHLVLKDLENLKKSSFCWQQALIVDAHYLPALKRMMELFRDAAEAGSPKEWDGARDAAQKVLAVDPSDRAAQVLVQRAVIEKWTGGIETDPQQVEDATAALLAMAQDKPFDANVWYYAMRAKLWHAQEQIRQNERDNAQPILAEVLKAIDEALAAHPEDALMHYRAAMALRVLGSVDRPAGQPLKYLDRIQSEFEKAAAWSKPDDAAYVEIKLSLGNYLEMIGDAAGAEKVYRGLFIERPDDLIVRRTLAEFLSHNPSHRAEAIDLLEHVPAGDPRKLAGIKAELSRQAAVLALASVINMKLDNLASITDRQAFDQVLKDLDEGYSRLVSAPGLADSSLALQIRGRLELARGKNYDAVQTLDRALKLLPQPRSMADIDLRYRLMYTLARAHVLTGNTGDAKSLLTQIVRDLDKFTQARLMLTDLLLQENNVEEARKHLDVLSKMMPDSPTVLRLTMRTLDKKKDKEKLAELYAKLPETTPQEALDKVQAAIYCDRAAEAVRLVENVHAQRPDDSSVTATLARLYVQTGEKGKAVSLVNSAIAKAPDSPLLKVLYAEVSGADAGTVNREVVAQLKDPFEREVALAQIAAQDNQDDEFLKHLQAASQMKPNDGRIVDMLYRYAVAKKDWDKANEYVQTLGKLNQDMAGGLSYRAQLALAQGKLDDAADQAQQLVQKMPEFGQSWVLLGKVLQAQQKYSEAAQNYNTALQKQPTNLTAILGLIDCSYAQRQLTAARNYIDQGRKIFPDNAVLREVDLTHELQYGDPEKVIGPRQEMLQAAIQNKAPNEAQAWLALGNTYLAVAGSKNDEQAARSFVEKARDTYAQASAKWPAQIAFVQWYAQSCLMLHDLNDGEIAIQALRGRPEWQGKPQPTLLLADYYSRAGKAQEQEKVLREYLSTAPRTVAVQVQLSSLLASRQKLDEALKVLEVNADDRDIRRQRIELQLNAGRLSDAEKEIQTALAGTTTPSPELQVLQAFVYMNSGRPSEARNLLNKILQSNPRLPSALYYRAAINVAGQQDLAQAISDLQLVRDSGFSKLNCQLLLSRAYRLRGDDDNAIHELETGMNENPADKASRLLLLDLYQTSKPPRWAEAERLLSSAHNDARLVNDLDLLHAEAKLWLRRKDASRAGQVLAQAMKLAPNDLNLFHTYCEMLLQDKQYDRLLEVTDSAVQKKTATWWMYQYRGRAKKAKDDKEAALAEFSTALDVASAARNDAAVGEITNAIAQEIGVKQAIARIVSRADKGDNRYRLMMVSLLQLDGDFPGAISWAEKVADDTATSADDLDTARRVLGTLYLRLDPPDTSKAIAVFNKLLDSQPADSAIRDTDVALGKAFLLNNLACTMIMPNSGYTPQQALAYSQRAFNLLDQQGMVNAYVFDTQGNMLVLNGRVDEGISLLTKAIDRATSDEKPFADVYYHLGEAYLALPTPMLADAQQALQQAQNILEKSHDQEDKPVDAELKAKIDKALQRVVAQAPASRQS